MTKTSEFRTKPPELSISAAAKAVFLPASHTEVPLNRGGFPVTAALELDLEPAWDARCLWCGRAFTPRMTGGSAQRFCCRGHRQQFWIAARRWTMRAIEAGLTLGGLLEGVSDERARCPRGVQIVESSLIAGASWAGGSECEISSRTLAAECASA
jgi:hypothetical protein